MKFLLAMASLSLFSCLSYLVFIEAFPAGGDVTKHLKALNAMLENATTTYGPDITALGLLGAGIASSLFFACLKRHPA